MLKPNVYQEPSKRDYEQIPGTIVFDGRRATAGYALNRMCISLNSEQNREKFSKDAVSYMNKFGLTVEQREAVMKRDWLRMLELGANIFFAFKIAIVDGLTMQHVAASMCGLDIAEYKAMMRDGGRGL